MLISPSILSVKKEDYLKVFKTFTDNGITMIHLDVMDGKFVLNTTYDANEVEKINKQTNAILDTHLMINTPETEIMSYILAGSDIITFHYEACKNIKETIKLIKNHGVKCGISVKPNTKIDVLNPYLKDLDLVLVMSVEPGFGGQKFMPSALDKIKYLKDIKDKHNFHYLIEVDGGINVNTAKLVKDVGCDVIVVGTYLMNSENFHECYEELKKIWDI